ncbi:MAG: PEP-CTERM sorting domain-containing protein [Phycisphaerae bacterium]
MRNSEHKRENPMRHRRNLQDPAAEAPRPRRYRLRRRHVPEPTTIALLGLGGLVVLRRRRR